MSILKDEKKCGTASKFMKINSKHMHVKLKTENIIQDFKPIMT